jgi:hypothetical protein
VTDSKPLDFSSDPELQEALNQWPGQPQVALERIRSLTDAGEESLAPLVAWMYTQVGPWNEGLPYARKAADRGIAWALTPYIANLVGAPEHHDDLLRFVSVQLDAGWSVEPVTWVPQLLQQGNQEAAWRLLELAGRPAPGGARAQWDNLMTSSEAALEDLQGAASKVGRTRVASSIG